MRQLYFVIDCPQSFLRHQHQIIRNNDNIVMDQRAPSRHSGTVPAFHFGDQGNALRSGPRDFTFRAQSDQPAPRFNQEIPQGQRRPQLSGRGDARKRGGRGGRGSSAGRGNSRMQYGTRPPRPHTSDRDLLRAQREPTPEQMGSMREGNARFRSLEDMSESDASMDLNSSIDGDDQESEYVSKPEN